MGTHVKEKPLILVVDDEVDITETYALYLSFQGFDVITANNASQALDLLSSRVPDLIISDCMMPHMDGVELSRQVRSRPDTRAIPIILMSGAPERHDLDSPTYDLFLRKPVFFDGLMPEIRRLLG